MRSPRLAPPWLLLVVVALTAGCVHETTGDFEAAATSVDEADRETQAAAQEVREVNVTYEAGGDESPEGVRPEDVPSMPRREPPEALFFHLGAGYGALGRVDLTPCRDQGLERGYLRMRVTFLNRGQIARASVEAKAAPPAEALTCIGEQLESAIVPAFGGSEVTLSKSFFVN